MVDLRKIEGVVRKDWRTVSQQKNNYIRFLTKDFKRGDKVKIFISIDQLKFSFSSNDAQLFLIRFTDCLVSGRPHLKAIKEILSYYNCSSLSFEQLKSLKIEIRHCA